ncbi:hypothetical protein Goklo_017696, partial [Gossypium klotzschianum]|nr:hypothetical protein [Gossypium klotzschianum]
EGDDKGVESDGEGDLERVESVGEDDVRGVQADGEGVSVTGIEVDEYGDGVDNVTAASIREEEDGNETEMFQDEHHCSISFKNKMMTVAMIAQHFEVTIKDHPKMKLREIQRRCAFEMHINVTINCCYRSKKIMKEKMIRNHNEEFGLL